MIGIYAIECIENGRKYIGSSEDINKRIYHHKWYLYNGLHANVQLQHDWNAYGNTSFVFYVITETDKSILYQKELDYIKSDESHLYNIANRINYSERPFKKNNPVKNKPNNQKEVNAIALSEIIYGKLKHKTKKQMAEEIGISYNTFLNWIGKNETPPRKAALKVVQSWAEKQKL